MEWIEVFWYGAMIATVVLCVIGYIRNRLSLSEALAALGEIRGLVRYAKKAMEDGRLSEKEREEIIDRVAAVGNRFV